MNPTLTALVGFVAWSLFLLVLMEVIRAKLVLTKTVTANRFAPNNSNLSPFMQRLARAHANCVEGLPIFGGLMLVAVLAGKSSITDPLAYMFLARASCSQASISARYRRRRSRFGSRRLRCKWALACIGRSVCSSGR